MADGRNSGDGVERHDDAEPTEATGVPIPSAPEGLPRAESPTEISRPPGAFGAEADATDRMDALERDAPRAESPTEISTPPTPSDAEQPRFVSMKPPTQPGDKKRTPMVPAIERPEMKPRLRPLSDPIHHSPSLPSGQLGHYAPPRERTRARPARGTPWGRYALLALIAALAGAGITFWLRTL